MTIIEQLEQSVSLPLLGAEQNIAHISLLEQFYALLIARLAQPQVYTQLLQAAELPTPVALTTTELSTADTAASSLFHELWQDPDQRKRIIDQLAATHHLDESATIALITSASVLSYHELKILADSILKISRLKKINGRTKFKGVPNIDLDSVVTLDGFGKKFDGEVYVTGVNHELEDGKVLTEISFGFNSNFLNTEKVLDKNNLVNSISGLHLGKVTEIDNDPLKQNRIKIQIPIISDKNKGIWAKLSHLFTSKNGGSFLIPEIGSQVVVSFIANDPRNPIILGSLYNHQFNPKYSIKKNNNIKSFTTKSNMVMEFDETENKITLSSPKGNKIVINEKSKEIKIIDENKNSICTSPNGIDIESKKNVSIVSGGNIELSASNKIILNSKSDTIINGSNILNKAKIKFSANSSSTSEIKSSGVTTLKGSIIQIN